MIVSRRARLRLVAEVGRDHPAQRRKIRPGAMQVFKEGNVDLIENLIARPMQFDHELGDERAPVDAVEALAAKFPPRPRRPPARPFHASIAASLLDHHRQGRDQFGDSDRQIEKFVARQLRMRAAQAVPQHFGERREPFAAQSVAPMPKASARNRRWQGSAEATAARRSSRGRQAGRSGRRTDRARHVQSSRGSPRE